MPLSEGGFPAKIRTMMPTLLFPCRAAAQFNHPATGNTGIVFQLASAQHWPGVPEPTSEVARATYFLSF
jgi:hypothetical protein